ncbi:CLUMA_CG019544, isoform A [Clunio marinus]|uniref:CLUMA_CG019544, isoform A n=1 Tax=Clunio marinus TaxID=568069 RepID=A0A1J1J5G3_9DIPT|nr:CLUMA_CG019544, isoform A [Clunio marinus]
MNRVNNKASRLIELYCEIELKSIENEPIITKINPIDYPDGDVLKIIPNFCYPYKSKVEKKNSPLSYSFVLTNESFQFGFVRKEIGSLKSVVILSYWPWHDVFLKFLNILADIRKKVSEKEFDTFLSSVFRKTIPDEHNLINLTFSNSSGNVFQDLIFRRPLSRQLPSIPENHNLNLFFNYIEPKTMIEIFAALLAERRIIFVSNNLDKLSSCLQASCSLLFPMIWQHIYIPILPMKLKDYLSAPMPFCIGCPEAVFDTVRREEIGDVVIIDCDRNCIESPHNDIAEMPQDIVAYLKKQLTNPSADLRGNRIPKIFLSSLVQIIGGYRDAIKYTENKLKFDNDVFIDSQSPSNKSFVQKIVQLQIFQQFVEERLKLIQNGSEMSDEFEMEVELHAERMGKKFNQYKEVFRNFRSRANPAMKNAVKSVRATCKELKLKIKDSSQKPEKFDYLGSISVPRKEKSSSDPFPSFQQFYPSGSNNLIESPSTSSSQSSTSDMNILQELEALPIFKATSSAANDSEHSTTSQEIIKDECNLIDLSDSIDSMQFDPLEIDERKNNINNNLASTKHRNDPFGSSELLRDVVDELNRSSTTVASKRSNWTKFE